jgi:hypothetical protein
MKQKNTVITAKLSLSRKDLLLVTRYEKMYSAFSFDHALSMMVAQSCKEFAKTQKKEWHDKKNKAGNKASK